ncbi:hypothetical protein P5V15_003411 [Pogonomyrmex californicus]
MFLLLPCIFCLKFLTVCLARESKNNPLRGQVPGAEVPYHGICRRAVAAATAAAEITATGAVAAESSRFEVRRLSSYGDDIGCHHERDYVRL